MQIKENDIVISEAKGNSAKDENIVIVCRRNMYDTLEHVTNVFYP